MPNINIKSHKTQARHRALKDFIHAHGKMRVADLALALGVSDETIRRDARVLAQRGDVVKRHGSLALPLTGAEISSDKRAVENSDAKRAIARQAALLVRDGDSLAITAGTTTLAFAQELMERRNLTVVTNSTEIAHLLAKQWGNVVYLAGGMLKADGGAVFGPSAVDFLAHFRVRLAFVSIAAAQESGIMGHDFSEAAVVNAVLRGAEHSVVLADASTFGKAALVRICGFPAIRRVITNAAPADGIRKAMAIAGTALDIAQA